MRQRTTIFIARNILAAVLLTAVYLESGPFTAGALAAMLVFVEHLLTMQVKARRAVERMMSLPLPTEQNTKTIVCEATIIENEDGVSILRCDKCKRQREHNAERPPPCVEDAMKERLRK